MKLNLVVFLAMCTLVVSYPLDGETRRAEMKDLLRELLLLDLEDESRLESSKRFNIMQELEYDSEIADKIKDMSLHYRYSYVAMRLSINRSSLKWEVAGTGDQGAGSAPTLESMAETFDDIKEKYLLPGKPVVVIVSKNLRLSTKGPYLALVWAPDPTSAAELTAVMTFSSYVDSLIAYVGELGAPAYKITGNKLGDITYEKVFE